MKHSFLMAWSKHASSLILRPQPACTVSCGWGNQSPHVFEGGQHFLLKGLPWLKGLDTEQLTWLPGSEVFSQQGPPPPQYTCCHHLSMARRHSLSQQMRGLSERAPQFLRDCGEKGGSRHARLWFLPTVLLLVQDGPDHSASAVSHWATWALEREWPVLTGWWLSMLWDNLWSQFVSDHVVFGLHDGFLVLATK